MEEALSKYIEKGYSVAIEQSWQDPLDISPEFLVRLEKDGDVCYAMLMFNRDPEKNDGSGSYTALYLKKACPEFWARLEGEQAQTQETGAEASASAERFETENGFNYNEYLQAQKERESRETSDVEKTVDIVNVAGVEPIL